MAQNQGRLPGSSHTGKLEVVAPPGETYIDVPDAVADAAALITILDTSTIDRSADLNTNFARLDAAVDALTVAVNSLTQRIQ